MTTTPTTHETVSATDVSTTTNRPTLFERPTPRYEYLGQDKENYHHHHDRITNTIHVTRRAPDEFHSNHMNEPWIRVRGWAEYPTPIYTRCTPDHLILELERPVTPGDVEHAHCKLQALVSRTEPTPDAEGERR